MTAVYEPSALAVLRRRAGLSQQQVAAEIGRHHSHIARIESGEYSVEPWVDQLAELYGVSPQAVRRAAGKRRA